MESGRYGRKPRISLLEQIFEEVCTYLAGSIFLLMPVEYALPVSIVLCCPRAWSSNLLQIQAPLIFNPENRENDTL